MYFLKGGTFFLNSMIDLKYKIIWERRKKQTQAKMGEVLLQLFLEKKNSISGFDKLRKDLKVRYESIGKYLDFLVVKDKWVSKIELRKADFEMIEETISLFNTIQSLTEREKRIHTLVYTALITKHE